MSRPNKKLVSIEAEIRTPGTPSHVDSIDHEVYELGMLSDESIIALGTAMTKNMLATAAAQRKAKAKEIN